MTTMKMMLFVYILFILCVKLCVSLNRNDVPENMCILITGLLFTLIISNYVCLKDTFEITLGKRCRGGAYLHQGDSELSKKCRELGFDNNVFDCPKTDKGMPLYPKFEYTPLSNTQWKNERCNKQ